MKFGLRALKFPKLKRINPQKAVSFFVLSLYLLSFVITLVTQISPPKPYFENPEFPYAQKVSEGVSQLKNYDPIRETLAAPEADLNLKPNNSGSYKWKVTLLSGTVFLFGKQTQEGILPKVRIVNSEGYFVEYAPRDFKGFVTPKVKENTVEWQIGEGLTARYTMQQDRVKADYIAQTKDALINNRIYFDIFYGNEKDEELDLIGEKMPNGDIEWITEGEGAVQNIFTFPKSEVKDAENVEVKSQYVLTRTKRGEYSLAITLNSKDLENAVFPLIIDPISIDASATATATAYGNGRKILRDAYGNLIALTDGGTGNDNVYYNVPNTTSWPDADIDLDGGAGSSVEIAGDLDSAGNVHLVFRNTTDSDLTYNKLTVTRNSSNAITSISAGTNFDLDTSDVTRRPSLIIANKGAGSGVEKVAVAYASNGTTRGEIRFMQCDVADGCDAASEWKNASEEINGNGTCSDSATSGDAGLPNSATCKGTTDNIFSVAANTQHHTVLTQVPGPPKRSPSSVKKDLNGSFTTLSNTVDSNTGTTDDINSFNLNDFLYIGDDKPFSKIVNDLTNFNVSVAIEQHQWTSFEYWNGSTWSNLSNVVDNTLETATSTSASYTEDGSIIFDEPSNWATTSVDSVSKYWIRLKTNQGFDSSVSIAEIYITDRNSKSLLIVGGVDSTDDLRTSYVIWDEINNDKWENSPAKLGTSANPDVGRPWIPDAGGASSALSDTGGNWTTYTNFPLSATIDYLNNRVYVGYVRNIPGPGDVILVYHIGNNKDLTSNGWEVTHENDEYIPIGASATTAISLTSDGADIYVFAVDTPGTTSLQYTKCNPSTRGYGNYCDVTSLVGPEWESAVTLDSATDRTHPQAVLSKMPGDTVAIDLIYTMDATPDQIVYERHYVDLSDKRFTMSGTGNSATYQSAPSVCPESQTIDVMTVGTDDQGCDTAVDFSYSAGARFNNVTISQGAVISTAYIDFNSAPQLGTGTHGFYVYGEDVDDSAVFSNSGSPNYVVNRTRTSSSLFSSQSIRNNYRIDVTRMVQEIICRGASNAQPCVGTYNGAGNWASGNDLSILFIVDGVAPGEYFNLNNINLEINLANATTGKSYSKGIQYPHTGATDLTNLDHPLSNIEFSSVGTDDTNYASISAELNPTASTSAVPMFMFKANNSNNSNTYKIDATAKFKSSIPTSSKTVRMQIYRGGSTDNWIDVDTDTTTAADTEFALDMAEITTNLSDYYFNETPGIGTQYAECTNSTANCWAYFRIWQEPLGQSGANQILYADYFSPTFTSSGPDKVAFSNSARTLTVNACNGAAQVFTMELQSGTTPTNPTSTTVVRVTSNSTDYTIYSDDTCQTVVTNGDFTYTTAQNTKSVYIVDNKKSVSTRTLTGTRQSGDTLTTGTQNYTVNAGTTATRLVVTMPGQTFSDSVGNSGSATTRTAGTQFNIVQITATDNYSNIITGDTRFDNDTRTLAYSGPGNAPDTTAPTYTTSVQFTNGVSTTTLATTLYDSTDGAHISLTVTDGGSLGHASSTFVVSRGSLGPATASVVTAAASANINENVVVTMTLKDDWDNLAANAEIAGGDIFFNSTTPSFSIISAPTDTNGSGVSTATLRWSNSGTKTINVVVDGEDPILDTHSIVIGTPTPASKIQGGIKIQGGTKVR